MYHMEVGYKIPAPMCKPGVSLASMDAMAVAEAKADHDEDPDHQDHDDEDMDLAAVDNGAALPSASLATSVVLVAAALMA
jgi:hypothetical protein